MKCTGFYKNGKPCQNKAKSDGRCGRHPLPTTEPKLDTIVYPTSYDLQPVKKETNNSTIKSMSTVKQPKRKVKKPELIVIDDILPIPDEVFLHNKVVNEVLLNRKLTVDPAVQPSDFIIIDKILSDNKIISKISDIPNTQFFNKEVIKIPWWKKLFRKV